MVIMTGKGPWLKWHVRRRSGAALIDGSVVTSESIAAKDAGETKDAGVNFRNVWPAAPAGILGPGIDKRQSGRQAGAG